MDSAGSDEEKLKLDAEKLYKKAVLVLNIEKRNTSKNNMKHKLAMLNELISTLQNKKLSSIFPADLKFVETTVKLVKWQYVGERALTERVLTIKLAAAKLLSLLFSSIPSSCDHAVDCDAITILGNQVTETDDMDFAKELLEAVKNVSEKLPRHCLEHGALMSMLIFCDSEGTKEVHLPILQRRLALSVAVNVCKGIQVSNAESVTHAVPFLIKHLYDGDTKVVEFASKCFIKIVKTTVSFSDRLDEILYTHELMEKAVSIIFDGNSGRGPASLGTSAYTALVHLLATCISKSPMASKWLLQHGIIHILKAGLNGSCVVSNMFITSAPTEQIFEIVNLANEFLPPSPAVIPPQSSNASVGDSFVENPPVVLEEQEDDSARIEFNAWDELLKEHPLFPNEFGTNLLPVLIQVYGSRVNGHVRQKCLSIILKLMYFSSTEILESLLGVTNIASFLAGVLDRKDPRVLIDALKIANILLTKLPEVFFKIFVKEGVVHAVDALLSARYPNTLPQSSSSFKKESNSVVEDLNYSDAIHFAQIFKNKFNDANIKFVEAGIPDYLHPLKALCSELNIMADHIGTSEKEMALLIPRILLELSNLDNVSTFELIRSGIVTALLRYLSPRGLSSMDEIFKSTISELSTHLVTRYNSFIVDALPTGLLCILVKKLQYAFSSLECFPVVLSDSSSLGIHYLSSAVQRFKLHLRGAQGEDSDYSSTVLFHPLAHLDDVESFLLIQIRPNNSGQEPSASTKVLKDFSKTTKGLGRTLEHPELIFSAGGKNLKRDSSVYEAIKQIVLDEDENDRYCGNNSVANVESRMWIDVYTIEYKTAHSPPNMDETMSSMSPYKSKEVLLEQQTSLLDSSSQGEYSYDQKTRNLTDDILELLRVLEWLNKVSPSLSRQAMVNSCYEGTKESQNDFINTGVRRIPSKEFINNKLNLKLARQIQDVLAVRSESLLSWCYKLIKECPFLFSFETRRQYFYLTTFGVSRALFRLQQQQGADSYSPMNEREVKIGALNRNKVLVSRSCILDSAVKIMKIDTSQESVLEVLCIGGANTGLEPTLEFYTLLSRNLQEVGLGMWRSSSTPTSDKSLIKVHKKIRKGHTGLPCQDLSQNPQLLFPRPYLETPDVSSGSKLIEVAEHFRLLGFVLAKVLQDGWVLDLPFSLAFYKLLLGQDLDMHDIISFDAKLGGMLFKLKAREDQNSNIESVGAELQSCGYPHCLNALPDYTDYTLMENNRKVDISNLIDYINLVARATIKSGIEIQLKALRAGFNQVFDISSLQIFSPEELECMYRAFWERETLEDHIMFVDGYTAKSPPIVNLLEILGELTPQQQQDFFRFVTGAPRLLPGSLAVLNPKLTISRKDFKGTQDSESTDDDDLPSALTSDNCLELPPYSTKEVMQKNLINMIMQDNQNLKGRKVCKSNMFMPLDLRPKKTRAIRRSLIKDQASLKTEREKKKHLPMNKYAIKP